MLGAVLRPENLELASPGAVQGLKCLRECFTKYGLQHTCIKINWVCIIKYNFLAHPRITESESLWVGLTNLHFDKFLRTCLRLTLRYVSQILVPLC